MQQDKTITVGKRRATYITPMVDVVELATERPIHTLLGLSDMDDFPGNPGVSTTGMDEPVNASTGRRHESDYIVVDPGDGMDLIIYF